MFDWNFDNIRIQEKNAIELSNKYKWYTAYSFTNNKTSIKHIFFNNGNIFKGSLFDYSGILYYDKENIYNSPYIKIYNEYKEEYDLNDSWYYSIETKEKLNYSNIIHINDYETPVILWEYFNKELNKTCYDILWNDWSWNIFPGTTFLKYIERDDKIEFLKAPFINEKFSLDIKRNDITITDYWLLLENIDVSVSDKKTKIEFSFDNFNKDKKIIVWKNINNFYLNSHIYWIDEKWDRISIDLDIDKFQSGEINFSEVSLELDKFLIEYDWVLGVRELTKTIQWNDKNYNEIELNDYSKCKRYFQKDLEKSGDTVLFKWLEVKSIDKIELEWNNRAFIIEYNWNIEWYKNPKSFCVQWDITSNTLKSIKRRWSSLFYEIYPNWDWFSFIYKEYNTWQLVEDFIKEKDFYLYDIDDFIIWNI